MNRDNRLKIAQETVSIIENASYQKNGTSISIAEELKNTVERTKTYSPEEIEQLTSSILAKVENTKRSAIQVWNCSSIEALQKIGNTSKIAILNFASAKNPGGGFLGGASAQEESLARSSSLYASLTKEDTMYQFNKSRRTFLYSDYLIYSPDTLFWFDDDGKTIDPMLVADVITSPAPNKGAMLQHNRQDEIAQIPVVFKNRIKQVLSVAVHNKIQTLILGAWGCGVFRNDTKDVAQYFQEVIEQHFNGTFDEIIFAIHDSSDKKTTLNAFKDVFTNN